MNDTSIVTTSKRAGVVRQLVGGQRARVDPLEHDDPRIAAQRPVELPVADVERDDARGAALQQHVGEAAGRRADVERDAGRSTSMPKTSSACASLSAAAADVRMVRLDRASTSASASTGVPALDDGLAVDADLAGEDQRARPLARRAPGRASTSSASSRLCFDAVSLVRADDPARDGRVEAVRRGAASRERGVERARDALGRQRLRCARGRTARDRSACRRRRPCRRSCRDRADAPSTSRMSSTIWNARPSSAAKRRSPSSVRRRRRRP